MRPMTFAEALDLIETAWNLHAPDHYVQAPGFEVPLSA